MSRYIDADAVCELFEPFTDAFTDVEVTSAYVQTLTLLANAPSIDIVRCKECKHWHREINESGVEYVNFSKCTKGHYGNGLDFHCADGEREGE